MSRGPTCSGLARLALVAALLVTAPVTYASPFLEILPHGILARIEATWTPALSWLRGWLDKEGEPPEEQIPPPAPEAGASGDCTDDGVGADPDGR